MKQLQKKGTHLLSLCEFSQVKSFQKESMRLRILQKGERIPHMDFAAGSCARMQVPILFNIK